MLAEALTVQGKNDEALAIYEERLRNDPNRSYVLLALGTFLCRTGKLKEGEERFREALRLDPNNAVIHLQLGGIALQQGRTIEAIDHYETAMRFAPDWPGLRENLARARQLGGQGRVPDGN